MQMEFIFDIFLHARVQEGVKITEMTEVKYASPYWDQHTVGIFTYGIKIVRDMMKNNSYSIVPVHQRPDLLMECSRLINSEWPSSDTRRLRTLNMSCDNFPTCLALLDNGKVIGHCKISLLPNLNDSCLIESVVIDLKCRSRGLGSMLMNETEKYVANKGIRNVYLATKGQEKFYEKNGYSICDPINIWGYRNTIAPLARIPFKSSQPQIFCGPPPPPMPKKCSTIFSPIISSKTYMVKRL